MTPLARHEPGPAAGRAARCRAPVFILGCGRSGTKLLYHMLLSSGGFAVYYSESNAFNLIGCRFGDLSKRANRERMLAAWLKSKLFDRTGLSPDEVAPRIREECRNAGDFLRILMETMARKQGVERWAESTPLHLLYLPLLKRVVPDALIVHIIRDGRDVAVSLNKIRWIRPFPWDKRRSLIVAGLFWRWIVGRGRKTGRALGEDYLEIHYEDLVQQPRETLAKVGEFIDYPLDYDRIQEVALGSVQSPNSSFRGDPSQKDISPMGRWRVVLSPSEIAQLEAAIGDRLEETGYSLSAPDRKLGFAERVMKLVYPAFFGGKLWLKSNTALARTADIGRMGIRETSQV